MHRLLIVDDDARIRRMLVRNLRKDYVVAEAESGEQALSLLLGTEASFDAVLLDQMMPEMDGIKTLIAIREQALHLPVIMLTAHGSITLVVEFMRSGGTDFIQKPIVNFDVIQLRIQRAIEASQELHQAIAQRQQVEEALRKSEERYRNLVEQAPDGIFLVDPEGTCIDVNTRGCEMLGYAREELLDICFIDLMVREEPGAIPLGQDKLGPGECVVSIHQLTCKNGSQLPVEINTTMLPDGRWQSLVRDITERQNTEIALGLAKDTAEAANRTKSEFLATISHEIRTPMNGVLGMTELILDTPLNEEQYEYAQTIYHSGETLLTLINDILDFSKIEAGKLGLETISFNLRETVDSVIDLLAEQATSKGLELSCLVHSDLPTQIVGDPTRVRQILTNLVGNAIKFTSSGEVFVSVNLAEVQNQDILIRFEIADTGIGIPPEIQDQLFEMFSQMDRSTNRKYGGSGLGLAISKQLAEMMDGSIGVNSSPDRGSIFWFTVRLTTHAAADVASPAARLALQHTRVLCVDNNTRGRLALKHQIRAFGMRPDCAADRLSTLDRLRAAHCAGRPYALLIINSRMPDMDGVAITRAIKAEPTLQSISIIMISASGRHNRRQEALSAGAAAFLPKPVRQSHLDNTIAKVLGTTVVPEPVEAKNGDRLSHATLQIRAKVLIAEDNVVNQKVTRYILEKLGCEVDVAVNGLEAVEAAARMAYDCIFMDFQMPEMDGAAATATIRAHEAQTDGRVPIIAMTANAMKDDRERCLQVGMDDYVSKPVKAKTLLAVLQKWTQCPTNASSMPHIKTPSIPMSPARLTAESVSPALDNKAFTTLKELSADEEPTFLSSIVEMFVQNATAHMATLHTAAEMGDTATIESTAHSLISSSAHVGALGMSELCKSLQSLGQVGTVVGVDAYLKQLDSEFDRVVQELEQEVASTRPISDGL